MAAVTGPAEWLEQWREKIDETGQLVNVRALVDYLESLRASDPKGILFAADPKKKTDKGANHACWWRASRLPSDTEPGHADWIIGIAPYRTDWSIGGQALPDWVFPTPVIRVSPGNRGGMDEKKRDRYIGNFPRELRDRYVRLKKDTRVVKIARERARGWPSFSRPPNEYGADLILFLRQLCSDGKTDAVTEMKWLVERLEEGLRTT